MKTSLTHRQERFVYEYLLDQNASAAAQRAGYSAKTRGTQAAEVMKNPLVKARIVRELADLYTRLKLNALDMLKSQVAAAYFDPAKLFDANQEPVPLDQLDAETRAALTISYDRRRNGEHVLRVRQTPRHVALAALWKRFDAFERMQAQVEAREDAFIAAQEEDAREERRAQASPAPAAMRLPVLDVERMAVPASASAPVSAPAPAVPTPPPSMPMTQADAEIAQAARALEAAAQAMPADAPPAPGTEPVSPSPMQASASASAPTITESRGVPAEAPPQASPAALPQSADDAYDFRKDPNWMWGGRQKPTPEPKPNPLVLQAMADAKWREQNAALLGRHMKVKPGAVIAPTAMEPGYNPPWLRDPSRGARPRFAEGAGEFEWS